MNAIAKYDADAIREVARGNWRDLIFPTLGIEVGHGEHRPCPYCGGKDRFRCDDQDGSGSWYCNQCEPHAGDGFALVMKIFVCDFSEALRRVADTLGVTPSSSQSYPRPQPRSPRTDPHKTAFQLELHGIALQARAEATRNAASGLDCSSWSGDDWDAAMNAVCHALDDLIHTENLFDVADRLRERAFAEEQADKKRKEQR